MEVRRVSRIDRLIVSTEDYEIAEVASRYGAELPFIRPTTLAQNDSPTLDVVLHALDWLEANEFYKPDAVLLLQPTSPFRLAADVERAIDLLITRKCPAVVSITPSHPHPFLAFRLTRSGSLRKVWRHNISHVRRQDLPETYHLNGAIYLIRTPILRTHKTFLPKGTKALIMPRERSLDIDEPYDLLVARAMVEGKLWQTMCGSQAA